MAALWSMCCLNVEQGIQSVYAFKLLQDRIQPLNG